MSEAEHITAPRSRPQSLTRKALGGASTSVIGRVAGLLASLGAMSILTRLLTPRDYGVFSILIVLSGFAALISQALGNVITQQSVLDRRQISGGFTIVLASSVLLAASAYAGFGYAASLYPGFDLMPYRGVVSALIPLTSVTAYFDAVQARQFKFKTIALIELLLTNIAQSAGSIALAYAGWGAWSLIAGYLFATIAKFSAQLATGMLPFVRIGSVHARVYPSSAWFLSIGVVNYVGRNADNAIVGYLLGPTALGTYSRAFNLMMRPVTTLGGTVMTVFYPVLASIGQDAVRARTGYLRALKLAALLCLPASAFAVMYSDEIVRFLFGDKWTGVTLPFSILIGALYFRLAYRITEAMAFSKNALAGTALRQTLYGAMVVGGSLIGSKWGVAGIAVGVTAALAVFFVLSAGYANRLSRTSLSQFVSAHAPAVFLTAVVVACISMLKSMFLCHFSPLNSLLGGATAFLLISAAFVLFGPEFLFGDSALRAVRSSFQARFFGYPRL